MSPRARARAAILAALVLAAIAPTAMAQVPTREEPFPVLISPRRWGPLLIQPQLVLESIGYEGNVFLTAPTEVSGQDPVSSFYARAGADLTGQIQFGPNIALTFHDRAIGEIYAKSELSALNHLDNQADGQLDVLLGPVLLTAGWEYSSIQDTPTFDAVDNLPDQQTRIRTNTPKAALRLFLSPLWDVSASAREVRTRYSNPQRTYTVLVPQDGDPNVVLAAPVPVDQALDRDRLSARGEIGWRPRGSVRFYLAYERADLDFTFNQLTGTSSGEAFDIAAPRDATGRRWLFGINFNPLSRLSGTLEVGKATIDPVDPDSGYQPFDGLVGVGTLTWRPSGASRVTFSYERDATVSIFENNLYYEITARSLDLEYFFGRRWGVQGGIGRDRLFFPEESPELIIYPDGSTGQGFDPGIRRQDRIDDIYVGFMTRIVGDFQIGLRYGVRDRTSNDPFAEDRQPYLVTVGSIEY
ncbi:MAG: hypothetical protein MUF27_06440 [Acidobacteria bacterium]|jgi:hypothetical protein|nr:hypothetical protein [Acidobacteriota bacterium]